MKNRKNLNLVISLLVAASFLFGGNGQALAQQPKDPGGNANGQQKEKITPADRQAAAQRAEAAGFELEAMGEAEMAMPGAAPRYFSHPNYANSPLRLPDALVEIVGDGKWAEAAATVDLATGAITAIEVIDGGSGYTDADVVISTAIVTPSSLANATAVIEDGVVTEIIVADGGSGYVTPGIRKFVDSLPGLGPSGENNLGQYIPVAVPDTTTYQGADYYEIAVVQYQEQMHSDLPPTTLRGYVQLETTVI